MNRQAIILFFIVVLIGLGFVFFRDDKVLPKVEPTPSSEVQTDKIYFERNTNCVEGGIVVECKG